MIRKVIKIGNSEGIVIPVAVLRAHKLKEGDEIEVLIAPPGEIARKLEFLQELEDFQKFRTKVPKKPAKGQLL